MRDHINAILGIVTKQHVSIVQNTDGTWTTTHDFFDNDKRTHRTLASLLAYLADSAKDTGACDPGVNLMIPDGTIRPVFTQIMGPDYSLYVGSSDYIVSMDGGEMSTLNTAELLRLMAGVVDNGNLGTPAWRLACDDIEAVIKDRAADIKQAEERMRKVHDPSAIIACARAIQGYTTEIATLRAMASDIKHTLGGAS